MFRKWENMVRGMRSMLEYNKTHKEQKTLLARKNYVANSVRYCEQTRRRYAYIKKATSENIEKQSKDPESLFFGGF